MFVKLILLILALGSTGVGVLSVRQSRLIASNEMTQARMRSRDLDRRSMELRAQIARSVTPDQLRALLGDEVDGSLVDETQRRIDLLDPVHREPVPESAPAPEVVEPLDADFVIVGSELESSGQERVPDYWTLDDGTRVYVVD